MVVLLANVPFEANGYTELPMQQSTNEATTQDQRNTQMPFRGYMLRRKDQAL